MIVVEKLKVLVYFGHLKTSTPILCKKFLLSFPSCSVSILSRIDGIDSVMYIFKSCSNYFTRKYDSKCFIISSFKQWEPLFYSRPFFKYLRTLDFNATNLWTVEPMVSTNMWPCDLVLFFIIFRKVKHFMSYNEFSKSIFSNMSNSYLLS